MTGTAGARRAMPPAAAEPAPQKVTSLRSRHLLSIGDLSVDEIMLIFDTAEAMQEIGSRPIKKVPALRGKTIVNLFYEPSTRTRTSFEIAEKRLSADALNVTASGSSIAKARRCSTRRGISRRCHPT